MAGFIPANFSHCIARSTINLNFYSVSFVLAYVVAIALFKAVLLFPVNSFAASDTAKQTTSKKSVKHNHLINEFKPYRLQHVTNPIDWFPWGTEAFDKAKREDKPVFLSIGYSTSHRCHVMEHESFSDPAEVAELLNRGFISIKMPSYPDHAVSCRSYPADVADIGDSLGLGYVFSPWASVDFYGTYYLHMLERGQGTDPDNIDIVMAGARVKF